MNQSLLKAISLSASKSAAQSASPSATHSANKNKQFFIGDLHLDPENLASLALAERFFAQARGAKALYILGDLFEYWVGDDVGVDAYASTLKALLELSDSGCELWLMHGNRDFLIGEQFAHACHARVVVDDELIIELDGIPVLLMHGDTLCTDDIDYQRFRTQMRDASWQQQFLAQTVEQRIAYAHQLREQSRVNSAAKSAQIMDVNEDQVQQRLQSNDTTILIHGHTHKPAIHHYPDLAAQRFVVGDWHNDHAQYVVHDHTGLHLRQFNS